MREVINKVLVTVACGFMGAAYGLMMYVCLIGDWPWK